MKRVPKKKKTLPRLPVDILLRLGSHPLSSKKGAKGYTRKKTKDDLQRVLREERISP